MLQIRVQHPSIYRRKIHEEIKPTTLKSYQKRN